MSKTLYRLKPIPWSHRVLGGEDTYSARVTGMYVFISSYGGVHHVYYEYDNELEKKDTYGTIAVAKAQAEREIERHLTKHFERVI